MAAEKKQSRLERALGSVPAKGSPLAEPFVDFMSMCGRYEAKPVPRAAIADYFDLWAEQRGPGFAELLATFVADWLYLRNATVQVAPQWPSR